MQLLVEAVRDGNMSLKELGIASPTLGVDWETVAVWRPPLLEEALCRNDLLYKEIEEIWKNVCLISEKSEDALTRQAVGLLSNKAIFCYFLPVSFTRGSSVSLASPGERVSA